MEPNGSGALSSYFHHNPPPPPQQPPPPQIPSPVTTLQSPSAAPPPNGTQSIAGERGSLPVFPHPLEPVRKKRGRPRKYPALERGSTKTTPSLSSSFLPFPPSSSSSPKKRDRGVGGIAGPAFTPHIIKASAGEDVAQKVMLFMQQCKRELCILSASGSISNACLSQPSRSGGNVTVEGRFEILSLSGCFVRTEIGGRNGGLSVCLSNVDGQIFGGGVGGPLKAAGPVQVIVGTFLPDTKKDAGAGSQAAVESSGTVSIRETHDHQSVGRNPFAIQPRGMPVTHSLPTGWRGSLNAGPGASYELTGTGHETQESPENGSYD